MPTPVFCCGFECGQLGTVGQHWNAGSSFTISTSTVRSGVRSLRYNPSATSFGANSSNYGGTIYVGRFYINVVTNPIANCSIVGCKRASDQQNYGLIYKSSDSKYYAGATGYTFGATGVTLSAGWHLVDVKVNVANNPHLIDVSVDGVALGQASVAVAATTIGSDFVGDNTSVQTCDIYIDDIVVSTTSGDYPIGAGKVEHFVATSDGTHTATTTTIVKGTIAAPTGGGNVAGATDVFNWVNGVPLLGGATDNTRLVNQQTAGTTLYAEEIFGPAPGISTPTVAPRAVEVITVDRQASTAVGSFETKLNDNGTENAIVSRIAAAGVITDRYARKHYALAPTGGAWTVVSGAGNFNNIRARFGYSGDATPDQYWRGIMIEAEFATIAAIPNKIIQVNQSVNRSNTY